MSEYPQYAKLQVQAILQQQAVTTDAIEPDRGDNAAERKK